MFKEKPRFRPSFWRIIRNIILIFFLSSIGWTILTSFIPVWFTPLMVIRTIEAIADGEKPVIKKQWVPIEEINIHMMEAVIASEDNFFQTHHGFHFESIKKAWEHNQKGKRIRGGSTISQQTAKNVFLWPKRSYLRKGLEAYFTVLIEIFWSKKRIMEVYLNVIETGNGIYGVQAAAQEYFGKDAAKLNRSQSALIAVCLPNPRKFNAGHPSSYIRRRKNFIMRMMYKIQPVELLEPKKDRKK